MSYVLINNNKVVSYPYSLTTFRAENPNVSLPEDPTEAQLNEQGIYTVQPVQQPSFDWITQSCVEENPVESDSLWYQNWVVLENSPEQIVTNENTAKANNKQYAETLLDETDWTATVDINDPQYSNPYLGNQPEFLAYRSQVRQIAVNPPVVVVEWPTKPAEVWVTGE